MDFLFHCFPGFLSGSRRNASCVSPARYDQAALIILESILRDGLLLVPGEVKVRRPAVGELSLSLVEENTIPIRQVRSSFTLGSLREVFGHDAHGTVGSAPLVHSQLFGEYGVGLDPIQARAFSIVPVVYYYSKVTGSEGFENELNLSNQLLNRLYEIRQLLAALATLEAIASGASSNQFLLRPHELERLDIGMIDEVDRFQRLKAADVNFVTNLFGMLPSQGVPVWNLFQNLDFLFSMFETADSRSTEEGTRYRPLAYFQQREWRIVLQFHEGMELVALDPNKQLPDRNLERMRSTARSSVVDAVGKIKKAVVGIENEPFAELSSCWLLRSVFGSPFRNFVRCVVAPRRSYWSVKEIVARYCDNDCAPEVVCTEN